MTETWLPISGYEGLYEVSDLGRVRSLDRTIRTLGRWGYHARRIDGKVIRQVRGSGLSRYLAVGLHGCGPSERRLVHRLVCEAFHGPPPSPAHQAAHGDGDWANNRADNLRWATRRENMADCVRHGTIQRGERHFFAKLDEQKVREIRAATGITQHELAAQYGVAQSQIWSVKSGRTWRHVA